MSAIDTQEFRQLLEEQRRRVAETLEHLHRENSGSLRDETDEPAIDNHLADAAAQTLDREIDFTLEAGEEEILRAIDTALAKIDEGTYGLCERCGKPIAEERLRALPYATLCIDDKRKAERG